MKYILYVLALILTVGCETNNSNKPDCSAVLCPAFTISVKIIDKETNTNYIVENNITEKDIEIKNSKNESINFEFVSDSTSPHNGIIILSASPENMQILSIKNLDDITISYMVSLPKTNECCDYGSIKNLMVDKNTFEFDSVLRNLIIYL